MKIGYARVSTLDQNLGLQMQALKEAGCSKVFSDKASGTIRQRPEFVKMLDHLRQGDTVVVWRLDRLARSTRHLLETMDIIQGAGARFQSLSEPWADTTTNAGKMIMTVFAGIAEFERALILERTQAGRIVARAHGVRFGRPRKLNAEQLGLAQRLLDEGKPARQVAGTFKVHPSTIYRLEAAGPRQALAGEIPAGASRESATHRRRGRRSSARISSPGQVGTFRALQTYME